MTAHDNSLPQLLATEPADLYQRAIDLAFDGNDQATLPLVHRLLMVAALKGFSPARYQLGVMNQRGTGVPQDKVRALMWFSAASRREEPRAAAQASALATQLSRAQITEAHRRLPQLAAAEEAFRLAWRRSDPAAMTTLGAMLLNGDAVDRDPSLAVFWLNRASDQGLADAQWRLGLAYAQGEGIGRDLQAAARLFEHAAEQGSADAQYYWAQMLERHASLASQRARAFALYEAAAEQGHLKSQLHLAFALKDGDLSLPGLGQAEQASAIRAGKRATAPHLVRALTFFRLAAEQDHPEAQFELGQMYAQGLGTRQLFEDAVHWYQRAASHGHAKAQFNLGFLHAYGQGVEQDYLKAYEWYCISDQCGYPLAKKQAALLARRLDAGERELALWRAESFVFRVRSEAAPRTA